MHGVLPRNPAAVGVPSGHDKRGLDEEGLAITQQECTGRCSLACRVSRSQAPLWRCCCNFAQLRTLRAAGGDGATDLSPEQPASQPPRKKARKLKAAPKAQQAEQASQLDSHPSTPPSENGNAAHEQPRLSLKHRLARKRGAHTAAAPGHSQAPKSDPDTPKAQPAADEEPPTPAEKQEILASLSDKQLKAVLRKRARQARGNPPPAGHPPSPTEPHTAAPQALDPPDPTPQPGPAEQGETTPQRSAPAAGEPSPEPTGRELKSALKPQAARRALGPRARSLKRVHFALKRNQHFGGPAPAREPPQVTLQPRAKVRNIGHNPEQHEQGHTACRV